MNSPIFPKNPTPVLVVPKATRNATPLRYYSIGKSHLLLLKFLMQLDTDKCSTIGRKLLLRHDWWDWKKSDQQNTSNSPHLSVNPLSPFLMTAMPTANSATTKAQLEQTQAKLISSCFMPNYCLLPVSIKNPLAIDIRTPASSRSRGSSGVGRAFLTSARPSP